MTTCLKFELRLQFSFLVGFVNNRSSRSSLTSHAKGPLQAQPASPHCVPYCLIGGVFGRVIVVN